MSSRNPTKRIPLFLSALCGLLLVGTTVGCQLPHRKQMQAASHPRRLQFGWPPFNKSDRSSAGDISQTGLDEIEPVTRTKTKSNETDTPRDPKWSKWLDYLPKAPRIPLPRTDVHRDEIAEIEPVETPPQVGSP